MEIAGELWTPPYILVQKGNYFLQLLSPVCVSLKAEGRYTSQKQQSKMWIASPWDWGLMNH